MSKITLWRIPENTFDDILTFKLRVKISRVRRFEVQIGTQQWPIFNFS